MINIILWSKDRPAQLDLTLSSMKKHFKEWNEQDITVLCKWSSDNFKRGYERVASLHQEVKFAIENDFRNNTLGLIYQSKKEYTSFLVDDDVFINDISLSSPEFVEFYNNPLIATISCRICPTVDYCYTQNAPAKKPVLNEKRMWKWKDNCSGDWQYPWSVAGLHIFRKNDLTPLQNIGFRAPNTFEAAMCNIPFSARDWMICFENIKVFTGANNRVQNENANRNENSDSVHDLNNSFLSGKRLSPHVNSGISRNTCHGPVKYIWE